MKSKLYFGIILLSLFSSVHEQTIAQSPDWLWAKSMGGIGSDIGNSIAVDPSGNGDVYNTGFFSGTADFDPGAGIFNLTSVGTIDLFITKLDGSGKFVWAIAIGGVGDDGGTSITVDPLGSGDVYTTGSFQGTVDFDPGPGTFNLTPSGMQGIFISKLDHAGNFLWAKAISGTENSIGRSISVDPTGNGGVYTTGAFLGAIDFDPGMGEFYLNATGSLSMFISKLDSAGNFLWAKAISGVERCLAWSIVVDPAGSGDVYTTGRFEGTIDFDPDVGIFNLTDIGGQSIFISKLDRFGNFIWAKALTGPNNIYGNSITVDPLGGKYIYTTGVFNGTVDFDPGVGIFNLTANGYDIFISKLDTSGNFVWVKNMGGTGFDTGLSLAVDPKGSGDVYTTGYFAGTSDFDPGTGTFNLTSVGSSDIFISKLDDSGNFVWAKAIGGTGNDYSNSIVLDALGHVYMTGYFFSTSIPFGTNILTSTSNTSAISDIFIAKLDLTKPSGVDDSKTPQISIFPNPVTDKLTIAFDEDKFIELKINLINILGEIVFSSANKNIAHEKTIDISALENGIYFMELNMNGTRVVKKVVKE